MYWYVKVRIFIRELCKSHPCMSQKKGFLIESYISYIYKNEQLRKQTLLHH